LCEGLNGRHGVVVLSRGGALGRVVDTARDALTLLSSCKNEEGLAPSVPRRVVETEAVLIK